MLSKRLTLDERRKIESMSKDKSFSGKEISRRLKRSANCVNSEFRLNGGRENYNAIDAQIRAEKSMKLRSDKLSQINKCVIPSFKNKVCSDIENIKMHLDILIEYIKEIRNEKNNKD